MEVNRGLGSWLVEVNRGLGSWLIEVWGVS